MKRKIKGLISFCLSLLTAFVFVVTPVFADDAACSNMADDELACLLQSMQAQDTIAQDGLTGLLQSTQAQDTIANDELAGLLQSTQAQDTIAQDGLTGLLQSTQAQDTIAQDELTSLLQSAGEQQYLAGEVGSASSVSENVAKLTSFVKANGTYNSDNSSYEYMYNMGANNGLTSVISIMYYTTNDTLVFMLISEADSGAINVTTFNLNSKGTMADNLVMASFYPVSSNTDKYVSSMTSSFYRSTYTKDTVLNFSIASNSTGYSFTDSDLNELSNTHMQLAATLLYLFLYTKLGLTIGDIGFTSYDVRNTPAADPEPAASSSDGVLVNENGIYKYYENNIWISNKYGFVDYNGGKFLVANGIVASGVNGLAQDPVNTSDWYYCASGQAQTQYSGLAQYDGAWFYVSNGKLDTNYSGLVDYDGSKFIVAAGQIQTSVNGLWQNSTSIGGDGKWYFFANGQAQTSFSGLALYDGTWFYIENGYFDGYKNGYIEYNERIYYIEFGVMTEDYGYGNLTEKETNSAKIYATRLALGVACQGELGSYSKYLKDSVDSDWYCFYLEAGEEYLIVIDGWCEKYVSTTAMAKLSTPSKGVIDLGSYLESYGQDYVYYTPAESGFFYIDLYNFCDYSNSGKDWTYHIYVG